VLGIETSCDETAAAVVRLDDDGRAHVLSSIVASQEAHSAFGGVVPEIAARAHVEIVDTVIAAALREAQVGLSGVDGVAATAGPGLVGGVMVGLSAAKGISLARGLPLIAVNHLEGHALSARLEAGPLGAPFPFLLLLVSGGHCQLLAVDGLGQYTRMGATIDDAAGEAFDKTAKAMGLGYPGGPALERLAALGDPKRYPLPLALAGRDDFSFSGLKTAAARLAEGAATEQDRADLAASVQAAIARQLADRSARAMARYTAERGGAGRLFVVAGGVAANATVKRELEAVAVAHGFRFLAPPLRFCTDNAAMIALAGAERLRAGLTDPLDVAARPRWPLDAAAAAASPTHKPGRKGAKA